eukprot:2957763-Rhodomonas_salina.3
MVRAYNVRLASTAKFVMYVCRGIGVAYMMLFCRSRACFCLVAHDSSLSQYRTLVEQPISLVVPHTGISVPHAGTSIPVPHHGRVTRLAT